MEELSLRIKEERGGRGIREVAREIGISPATLSRVETGKQPDLKTFGLICQWLKLDPSTVLGLQKVKATSPTLAMPQAHFRAEKTMSPATAQNLAELILAINRATEHA